MEQIFPILPPRQAPYITILIIMLMLVALALLFFFIGHSMKRVNLAVSDSSITIHRGLTGRVKSVRFEEIVRDEVRVIDLRDRTEFAPRIRTGGVGLPGFQSGWFRLKNGSKALVFLTSTRGVVYIPTRLGYAILFSARDPSQLVNALTPDAPRGAAPAAAGQKSG